MRHLNETYIATAFAAFYLLAGDYLITHADALPLFHAGLCAIAAGVTFAAIAIIHAPRTPVAGGINATGIRTARLAHRLRLPRAMRLAFINYSIHQCLTPKPSRRASIAYAYHCHMQRAATVAAIVARAINR